MRPKNYQPQNIVGQGALEQKCRILDLPGLRNYFFSDKTLACLIDMTPKQREKKKRKELCLSKFRFVQMAKLVWFTAVTSATSDLPPSNCNSLKLDRLPFKSLHNNQG